MTRGAEIWAVYDRPVDRPDVYVVRKFVGTTPTTEAFVDTDLESVRREIGRRRPGAVRMDRSKGDPPYIIETWL